MKRKILYAVSLAFSFAVFFVFLRRERDVGFSGTPISENLQHTDLNAEKPSENVNTSKSRLTIPNKAERLRMSDRERIALLERLGYVPSPSDISDYRLAEKTSWWGKRLDPVTFWTNRVVWLDSSAMVEAQRRGRFYPPMPYEDPSVANLSDVDIDGDEDWTSIDGGWQPDYMLSEREGVFWDKFQKTHPQPPENIQHWLRDNADRWLRIRKKIEGSEDTVFKTRDLESSLIRTLRDANTFWYPQESITPEAYLWNHVMRKRNEYTDLLESGVNEESRSVKNFFNDVYVDRTLITEPLTQEQLDTANAWKVAYLNRLRAEQWDESYINAYLQAWNLSEEYVFGKEKK